MLSNGTSLSCTHLAMMHSTLHKKTQFFSICVDVTWLTLRLKPAHEQEVAENRRRPRMRETKLNMLQRLQRSEKAKERGHARHATQTVSPSGLSITASCISGKHLVGVSYPPMWYTTFRLPRWFFASILVVIVSTREITWLHTQGFHTRIVS